MIIIFALRRMILLMLFLALGIGQGYAQYARDTAFCVEVKNLECVRPVPHGGSVSISNLKEQSGRKLIYFWGNLRNPGQSAVAFYFLREGSCYTNEPISTDSRALGKVSGPREFIEFFRNLTFQEIWNLLGVSDVGLGAREVKINVVLIPEANQYRIYDFREVHCPGTFTARLVDSQGYPIPGENEAKIVFTK